MEVNEKILKENLKKVIIEFINTEVDPVFKIDTGFNFGTDEVDSFIENYKGWR